MTDQLFRIVYCSRTRFAPDADLAAEIAAILTTSRRNNGQDGLSGALLFSRGAFAQALEGPVAAVERTFERIQRDPRHDDIVILEAGPADRLIFAAWSMAHAQPGPGGAVNALLPGVGFGDAAAPGAGGVIALLRDLVGRERDWATAA